MQFTSCISNKSNGCEGMVACSVGCTVAGALVRHVQDYSNEAMMDILQLGVHNKDIQH